MQFKIRWDFYISTTSKDKCLKVVQKVIKAIDIDSTIDECEKYWKDKTLFEVGLTTVFDSEDIQSAVFLILILSSRICRRWTVGTPMGYADDRWEFSGWSCTIKDEFIIPGINDASFNLSNY